MTSRPSTAAPILAVLAIVLVMLGAYVGGYCWLGTRYDLYSSQSNSPRNRMITRGYRTEWMEKIFQPLASVECWLSGSLVEVYLSAAP